MFASTELVARIERAERRMLLDVAEAAQRREPERDALAVPLAGGVATCLGADSPLTKVGGLGFGEALDEAVLAKIERAWHARGAAVQVELATLADPSIGAALTRRGYVLHAFENVLGLALAPGAEREAPRTPFQISESGAEELALWTDVAITAFASEDTQGNPSHESFAREAIERATRDMCSAPGFTRYLARSGGRPAATASLRTFEGVAQLCGAATLPAFRRRGAHAALMHARLTAARRADCDVAVVTTLPGSKSQENAQRNGFSLLYARAILVLPPA